MPDLTSAQARRIRKRVNRICGIKAVTTPEVVAEERHAREAARIRQAIRDTPFINDHFRWS